MIRTNPKRSICYWKITLLFLSFLGSIELVSSIPANPEKSKEKASSLSFARRSSEQVIESPSELAWRAWQARLLMDDQPESNSNFYPASMIRRITPKSLFDLSPQLQACADGYRTDTMGRCQKIIDIDSEANRQFLLERLRGQSFNTKKVSSDVTGPLQVNIPFLSEANSDKSYSQVKDYDTPQTVMPLESVKQESVVNYGAKNYTSESLSNEREKQNFFLDLNSTIYKKGTTHAPSSPAIVVPVSEYIDEANKTFSDIVDYKTPQSLLTTVNHTFVYWKREKIDLSKENESTTENPYEQEENETKDAFLMSEDDLTTTPSSKEEIDDEEESYDGTTVIPGTGIKNLTESLARKEIISDGTVDIGSKMETWTNESDASLTQTTKKNETIEADIVYEEEFEPDQEEYLDTTQISEEDSGESEDEILKHGETGMTIPIKNQALIRSEKKTKKNRKKTPHSPKDDYPMETTTFFEAESHSLSTSKGGEDLGSNVSSEVKINKDFDVLEKVLPDVNTEKMKNSTKPVSANNTIIQQNKNDNLKVLFEVEKKLITEPEVVFLPQDNRGSYVYGRKRDGQLLKTDFQSDKMSHNSTVTEPPQATSKLLLNPTRLRDAAAPPIEEQLSFHSEKILSSDTKNKFPFRSSNLDTKSPIENYRSDPINNGQSEQNFVKFSNYERPHQDYVRFPSDDVNSIHNKEYKERFSFPREEYSTSVTNTKSPSFNPDQSNWWIPTLPRMDSQQVYMQSQTSLNQSPMLLRFWTRMPLLRDPSLNVKFPPTVSEQEESSKSLRDFPSRRMNFYKDTSSHEVKRVFSQNMRNPIGG